MKTNLAVIYNDKSPLENHHTSKFFRILMDDKELNIFEGLTLA
jgi:hypothetical protein